MKYPPLKLHFTITTLIQMHSAILLPLLLYTPLASTYVLTRSPSTVPTVAAHIRREDDAAIPTFTIGPRAAYIPLIVRPAHHFPQASLLIIILRRRM
jgi:hypothetical protein